MEDQSILTVEQRKKISMTCVASVDSFTETRISLTVGGQRAVIEGSKLKILSFSQGSGNFAASGEVRSVRYGSAKGKLAGLFK